jgi:sugar phosphate permease
MNLLALIIAIIALIISIIAYNKASDRPIDVNADQLREKTADALERIENYLRKKEKPEDTKKPDN